MTAAEDHLAVAPIDLEQLRRFTLGDTELEQEILGLFISHAPETLAVLQASASQIEWRAAAHGLKGSARAVGATAVADFAAAAERSYPESEADRQRQLAELSAAIDVARDYIAQLFAPVSPGKA